MPGHWEPAGYMVLVKPDFEKKTESGIVVVTEGNRTLAAVDTGTIVAIGPTAWRSYDNGEAWAKVGDRISYARHGGKIIKVPDSDEDLVLISDGDVRLVWKETQ